MTTLDRTFVGATGALLMVALVMRTVAQQPQTPSAAPNQPARPQASLIVNADEPAETTPTVADGEQPQVVDTADTTPTTGEAPPVKEQNAPTASGQPNAKSGATKATGTTAAAASATGKGATAKDGTATAAKPTANAPLEERNGDVVMRAKGGIYDEGNDIARLTRDVRLRQEGQDFVLTCQNLVYDRGLNRAIATIEVKIAGEVTTITGDELRADFDKKTVVLTGHVDMRSRGKGDGQKTETPAPTAGDKPDAPISRSKPSRLTCDRVEYDYFHRKAVATGNIKMMQEGSTGTCDKILFDEKNNIITLAGHASFANTKGQTLKGPTVTIWLNESKARLETVELTAKSRQTTEPTTPEPTAEPAPTIPEEWLKALKAPPAPSDRPVPAGSAPAAPANPPVAAPPADAPPADTDG